MGKRLYRYRGIEVPGKIGQLLNKELDLVMDNKSTLHGIITSCSSDQVSLKDKREKIHQISISRIQEVIIDQEAPY